MAGWAGHARGGTDVRANRIFTGGGGLTERQRHKEGKRNKEHTHTHIVVVAYKKQLFIVQNVKDTE